MCWKLPVALASQKLHLQPRQSASQLQVSPKLKMSWLNQLPQYWQSTHVVTWLLWPVEWVYRLVIFIRTQFYKWRIFKTHRVNATVIVVGNVVAGGGGKTPLTIALVNRLVQQGLQVGVITRGHGRKRTDLQVVNDQSAVADVGDEPLLIFQRCRVPVVVCRNRVQAAQHLLLNFPQIKILVSDDGLQHLALGRDIEICVMDAQGIGNGHLLPAGPLREPWPRTSDLLLHTQTRTFTEGFESSRQLSPWALSKTGQKFSMSDLKLTPIELVSGIANPQAFANMLLELGFQIKCQSALPDHDDFSKWQASMPDLPLLCTEKDAVKLWQTHPKALAVPLLFEPEEAFWQQFDALLQATPRYH